MQGNTCKVNNACRGKACKVNTCNDNAFNGKACKSNVMHVMVWYGQ
jgi:hypothetical protein